MKVAVLCETSGKVRESFRARGHDARSCDLLPAKDRSPFHYEMDVFVFLDRCRAEGWWPDLIIAHPDCRYLTIAAEWAYGDGPYHQKVKAETLVGAPRRAARIEAIAFARRIWELPIKRKALENPISVLSNHLGRPSQIIHPHEFGHDASKSTCLWLENLPPLFSTFRTPPRIVPYADSIPDLFGHLAGLPRWANQTDSGQNRLSPSADRWDKRAETYQGIADAMGDQWG